MARNGHAKQTKATVSVREAARMLGVLPDHVYRLIHAEQLATEGKDPDGRWMVRRDAVTTRLHTGHRMVRLDAGVGERKT